MKATAAIVTLTEAGISLRPGGPAPTAIVAYAGGGGRGASFPLPHANEPPFLDVLAGEAVTLQSNGAPISSIELVAGPDGSHSEIDGVVIRPSGLGRYHFHCFTSDGTRTDISLLVFEQACLDRLPDHQHPATSGSVLDKRQLLRNLARGTMFTGTAAELDGINLRHFGA